MKKVSEEFERDFNSQQYTSTTVTAKLTMTDVSQCTKTLVEQIDHSYTV